MRTRSGSRWLTAVALGATCGGIACTRETLEWERRGRSTGEAVRSRIGALAMPEREGRLLRVETRLRGTEPIRPTALRAGSGVVALVLERPSVSYLVELSADASPPMMGGPNGDFRVDGSLARGHPTDIVHIAPDARAWYLDGRSGRLVSEDMGGDVRLLATLDRPGMARAGCALDSSTLAYVTDAREAVVLVRRLDRDAATRTLEVRRGRRWTSAVPWSSVRFGGSAGGACVLWAPRMPALFVVSETGVRPIPLVAESPAPSNWFAALRSRLTGQPPAAPVLDVTTYPRGIAVLAGGATAGAGRMVDLYTDAGEYLQTMVLPTPALRIAGYGARLLVLRQRRDSVRLTSFVLPAAARRDARSSGR